MAESVTIAAGELSRYFSFGAATPPLNYATVAPATSNPIYKERVYSTVQAIVQGAGALTGAFTVEGTNDRKTALGCTYAAFLTNGSAAVTSGALFLGYPNSQQRAQEWVPPVAPGDLIQTISPANGFPAATTVSAVASASALTASANATIAGNVDVLITGNAWVALGTINVTGTGTATDGLAIAAAWRWIRVRCTATTGTVQSIQAVMGV